ncbi:unnamed protein product [Jaminaea pallidilutea]
MPPTSSLSEEVKKGSKVRALWYLRESVSTGPVWSHRCARANCSPRKTAWQAIRQPISRGRRHPNQHERVAGRAAAPPHQGRKMRNGH